jgi:hypothetical protein
MRGCAAGLSCAAHTNRARSGLGALVAHRTPANLSVLLSCAGGFQRVKCTAPRGQVGTSAIDGSVAFPVNHISGATGMIVVTSDSFIIEANCSVVPAASEPVCLALVDLGL